MFSSLSKKSVGALALFWSGSALAAGQCFAPSDPVRLTPDQQRAVVLNIRDNPDVFQSDFSLMRTLKNILGTVPGGDPATVTDDAAKDLLNSLLAGFGETSLRNDDGDISFTLVPRDGEKSLTADDLLGQTSPNPMVPVALFNRLDLTPADHSHCGEYRIVYVKSGPTDGSGRVIVDKRMTLIFEAVLPNPDLSGDRKPVWSEPGADRADARQVLLRGWSARHANEFHPRGLLQSLWDRWRAGPCECFRSYKRKRQRTQLASATMARQL
jgi:hypothetical protein